MSTAAHEQFHDDVGAYLLGALDPAELSAFEQHLADCAICRDEADRLHVAAAALPRAVDPLTPPPALRRDLMRVVAEEARQAAATDKPARRVVRRRLGRRGLLAGLRPEVAWVSAASVLFVGVALGYSLTQLTQSSGDARVVSAQVDPSRVPRASASLNVPTAHGGVALLRVNGMPPPKPGMVYEVWLKRGGEVVSTSLFSVDAEGRGSAAIPDGLSGASAVLVTREPVGGSPAPTEAPVISAAL